jgi:hypothetical protein
MRKLKQDLVLPNSESSFVGQPTTTAIATTAADMIGFGKQLLSPSSMTFSNMIGNNSLLEINSLPNPSNSSPPVVSAAASSTAGRSPQQSIVYNNTSQMQFGQMSPEDKPDPALQVIPSKPIKPISSSAVHSPLIKRQYHLVRDYDRQQPSSQLSPNNPTTTLSTTN